MRKGRSSSARGESGTRSCGRNNTGIIPLLGRSGELGRFCSGEAFAKKFVFPAKAGIHRSGDGAVEQWIPASAGKTNFYGNASPEQKRPNSPERPKKGMIPVLFRPHERVPLSPRAELDLPLRIEIR